MKVYAITYYYGDGDVTLKVFRDQRLAEEYADIKNKQEPATKHSGGAYYSVVEWEVE